MAFKQRAKGEKYRPIVEVLKQKDGMPTKVKISGAEYSFLDPNYINGHKNKAAKNKK